MCSGLNGDFRLAHQLVELFSTSQMLSQHMSRLDRLDAYLLEECSATQTLLQLAKEPELQIFPSTLRNTSDWTRNSKQLRAKLEEYKERLNTTTGDRKEVTGGQPSISKLVELEDELNEVYKCMLAHQDIQRSFSKLPSDHAGAKKQVDEAIVDLNTMRSQREALFEKMVTN